MQNKEHPHAEVLRAIADGVPLSEFEATSSTLPVNHQPLERWIANVVIYPKEWGICRKPQYIMVNGFKVPKPLDVQPEEGATYFIPEISQSDFFDSVRWIADLFDLRLFERRVCHTTKEAAIAHAKAMLGIDPEYF